MSDEHSIVYRLQPFTVVQSHSGTLGFQVGALVVTTLNWAALFGAAYVVGYGLRLGLGL